MYNIVDSFIDFCNQFELCAIVTDKIGSVKNQSSLALELPFKLNKSVQIVLTTDIQFLFVDNIKNAEFSICFKDDIKACNVMFYKKDGWCFFLFKNSNLSQSVVSSVDISEKLASMMRLSDGIAHNLRSPLMTLNNIADFMAMLVKKWQEAYIKTHTDCPFREKQQEIGKLLYQMQQDITTNVVLMSEIIDALRLYRQTDRKNKYQEIDIYDLIHNIAKMIEYNAKIDVVVDIIKPKALSLVYCIPADLQVVFANLFENAIEQLCEKKIKEGAISVCILEDNNNIQIKVRDNGGGIPIELLVSNELFEPFATRKIGGTGLGLHSCFKIIKEHGGHIEARNYKSSISHGAEFIINIPVKMEVV